MVFKEEEYELAGKKILLRPAKKEEASLLIDYLKEVCGETDFLLCYPDEVHFTTEQEEDFKKPSEKKELKGEEIIED